MTTESRPDIFEETMGGLEAGLRVSQIATFDLRTCATEADVAKVLCDPTLEAFDAIPVREGDRVVGVLERGHGAVEGNVRSAMLPLSEVRLTSADAPLLRFLRAMGEDSYTLVVNESGVSGIVTRSDLLKLPTRLLVFAFITHLELVMRETIRRVFKENDESWLSLLSDERRTKTKGKLEKLKPQGMDPDLLELTELCDKRQILATHFRLGPRFRKDLEDLGALRDSVAHAATFLEGDADIGRLSKRLEKAEHWIHELRSLAT